SFCLARSCTPKSDSLPLRRWPCWPGPYSRRFTGLLGRPQIFWPIRRSILYFASLRFVIASSISLEFEETRPPVRREFPGADRSASKARGGPRVAKRNAGRKRPASKRGIREKAPFCQRLAGVTPGQCEALKPESRDSPRCNCTSEARRCAPARNDGLR